MIGGMDDKRGTVTAGNRGYYLMVSLYDFTVLSISTHVYTLTHHPFTPQQHRKNKFQMFKGQENYLS